MNVVVLILLVAGFVLFLLGAFLAPAGRVNLIALGLACWILTAIVTSPVVH